jgi:TetR/AcrR family transcriptional regulator, lmrAB and yxaGH operons repressor
LLALETWQKSERLQKACETAFKEWQNMIAEKLTKHGWDAERAHEKAIAIHALLEGALMLCITKKRSEPLRMVISQAPLLLK